MFSVMSVCQSVCSQGSQCSGGGVVYISIGKRVVGLQLEDFLVPLAKRINKRQQ